MKSDVFSLSEKFASISNLQKIFEYTLFLVRVIFLLGWVQILKDLLLHYNHTPDWCTSYDNLVVDYPFIEPLISAQSYLQPEHIAYMSPWFIW